MQIKYFGIDKKAEKVILATSCETEINLPVNYKSCPFSLEKKKIREHYLLRFKDVFISPDGVLFKKFSFSKESIFHKNLEPEYSNKFRFFKRNYLKYKTVRVKKAMIISDPWSLINYYHWICDSLTRLALAIKYFDQDCYLIVPYEKYSINQNLIIDSIKAFGIPEDRIIRLEKNQKVKAQELLMPAHIAQQGTIFFRPEIIDVVRKKLLNFYQDKLTKNLGKRIYISRSKALYRKIDNENELIELLKKYDFSIVNMEDYSFLDQISIAHKADSIISCHGAGLSNIIFMKKNSFVLELINENLERPHFYSLSSGASLNYICHKSKQKIPGNFEENSDIIVDLSKIERDLQLMISN